jgi:hypothetical protein
VVEGKRRANGAVAANPTDGIRSTGRLKDKVDDADRRHCWTGKFEIGQTLDLE